MIEKSPGIDVSDIASAASHIRALARRTPIIESDELNSLCGGRVLLKAEIFQRTGSFKFRGAANFLLNTKEAALAHGVAAVSSGNHGRAVAFAASLLGMRATVFMPHDAPKIKILETRKYATDLVLYDRFHDNRDAMVRDFIARNGAIYVSPFDDPFVIAGQGTLGLELVEQAMELGVKVDSLIVPCGGGGLSSGVITAIKASSPDVDAFIVEPRDFDDTGRSLTGGKRTSNSPSARSICDALQSPTPGMLTFPILKNHAVEALKVSDDEVRWAMYWAFERLKLVIEPSGAVGLAAVLFKKVDIQKRTAAIVLSGANVDQNLFANILKLDDPEPDVMPKRNQR